MALLSIDDTEPVKRTFWQFAFCPRQIKNALLTAAVVGTLLNSLNQGSVLLSMPAEVNWFKFFFTYLVPYCVATYAGATGSLRCAHMQAQWQQKHQKPSQ
ncbi:nitrate/nitrite transporter NrtS [Gayadomonas joobiniege]|uniref:nitrate/nitrite transporter NrtS n=1 Tax=Gayadomonas joobiniege TaxID=1234606 RepID=UPI000375A09D|nr:nitrate/nitrite transporter NrtS [Gayadomonas joobiniege]